MVVVVSHVRHRLEVGAETGEAISKDREGSFLLRCARGLGV